MKSKSWSKWTPEVVSEFTKDYPYASWDYLIEKYPFSKATMMSKAGELGVRRKIGKPESYTEIDDKIITECFMNGESDEDIANKLGRSVSGVKTRREKIGLYHRKGRWLPEENAVLIANYEKMPVQDIVYKEQSRYPLGVCLSKDIHAGFHNIYNYGSNTIEQFMEYIHNYYPNCDFCL